MKKKYDEHGIRRSVRAVFLIHSHGHPHILCRQRRDSTGAIEVDLFGGTLQPEEPEKDGLNRKLRKYIFNPTVGAKCEWVIEDLLSIWWRPNFDDTMLPYLPPHVTRPRECMKVYQVIVPEKCVFVTEPGEEMIAIPLFDLLREEVNYSPMLKSIPSAISRFALTCYELS